MMMIEIICTGGHACGKSHARALMIKALEDAGYECHSKLEDGISYTGIPQEKAFIMTKLVPTNADNELKD